MPREREMSETDERTEQQDEQDETEIEAELDALIAVARLDLEAAMAYDIAGDAVDDEELEELLAGFADDHRRHVEEIRALVEAEGFKPDLTADPDRASMPAIVRAVVELDPDVAVAVMITNEELTNATYATGLKLVSDERAIDLLTRGLEDERRHLSELVGYRKRAGLQ